MSEPVDDPLAPRRAALNVLEAALTRRGGLDEALAGKAMLALSPRDRGFARALAPAGAEAPGMTVTSVNRLADAVRRIGEQDFRPMSQP